ncbi:hypothetical protein [Kitasatospora sp. NBC_01266]|uniref:hypothetical protein n=1 Tax=Kitasatospora sp. NBC_01266 TaxID=2903572 RepID=UPI002E329160|nr:hypothetical protein [Kitasatospora sp. NBC_01266]
MSVSPPLTAMVTPPSPAPAAPGGSLDRPFNRLEALADLASLGRQLDHQVTRQEGGATPTELDTTLTTMRAVHDRIVAELGKSLNVRSRQITNRQKLRTA